MSFSTNRRPRRPSPIRTDISPRRPLRSPPSSAPTPKSPNHIAARRLDAVRADRERRRQAMRRQGLQTGAFHSPRMVRANCIPARVCELSPIPDEEWTSVGLLSSILVYNAPFPDRYGSTWPRVDELKPTSRSLLMLWGTGPGRLGCRDDADVFVRAMPLVGARGAVGLASEEPDVPTSSLSSPTSIVPKRLSIRAIVHSKSHPPIGLKREFDLDALRDTIPTPLLCSAAPNFNREEHLSKLQSPGSQRRASCPAESAPVNEGSVGDEAKAAEIMEPISPISPIKAQRSQSAAVPIHLEFARLTLPALAAIMMSDLVKRGDTIELALPHPRAWPETVTYIYCGLMQYLSDETRQNIIYLGGRIGQKMPDRGVKEH